MMEFIDLKAMHENSRERIDTAISRVLEHGKFINGPEVYELEDTLSQWLGGINCVAVSSGTHALEIAMRALDIGPGDEVITTPFTWISSAETISLVGATPVFADIEEASYNIDSKAVEAAITNRTKAIIAVNLFGQMADYPSLEKLAEKHGIYLIEDAAQSLGAEQNGRKSCTIGTVSCTSFFPAKPLGCYGDGGAVFTRDKVLSGKIRAITNHGGKVRGEHHYVGTNGRFDTLQAAIVLAKFPAFKEEITRRTEIGARYTAELEGICQCPAVMSGNTHVYAQYTIRPRDREILAAHLKTQGIPTAVYYRNCLHQQKVFEALECASKSYPVAEKAAREVLSLPFHPYLEQIDQDRIIQAIIECETSDG